MRQWNVVDEDLALHLQNYVRSVKRRGKKPWKITDENKPWSNYYAETSRLFLEMRALRLDELGGRK
jgi:hypothetical protein